jgi:hypothetical protein
MAVFVIIDIQTAFHTRYFCIYVYIILLIFDGSLIFVIKPKLKNRFSRIHVFYIQQKYTYSKAAYFFRK